jgi:hypothetical protein
VEVSGGLTRLAAEVDGRVAQQKAKG